MITYTQSDVRLTSPTDGKILKIMNPEAKFCSSHDALKELMAIEHQIGDLSGGVLPDFGYSQDNYILDRFDTNGDKWKTLSQLIRGGDKFGWLANFIKVAKLEN